MVAEDVLRQGLDRVLTRTDLPLACLSRGKVRDSYRIDANTRLLVTTDRISAMDRVLGTLPFKGQVLQNCSRWWFDATRASVPNHLIDVIDPNAMRVHEAKPFAVEFVVRAYLTGSTSTSIWTHYAQGSRCFCGHELPDGLQQHQALPNGPIVTPSTKAPQGQHDRSVGAEQLIAEGVIDAHSYELISTYALALFRFGQEHCAKQGLLLVDSKYEFGQLADGRVVLIDELHTPDSSRFWLSDAYAQAMTKGHTPPGLDKDYVRRWLQSPEGQNAETQGELPEHVRLEGAKRYIEACERICGMPFVPDVQEPQTRLMQALET